MFYDSHGITLTSKLKDSGLTIKANRWWHRLRIEL